MNLYCLHGFLGNGKDWSMLSALKDVEIIAPDLFMEESPLLPLWDWADAFHQKYIEGKAPGLLVGYSLGGRLAMHLLAKFASSFFGAVIISAHPGLSGQSLKSARLKEDARWADDFEKASWDSLMERWNARSVFVSDVSTPTREEKSLKRARLAEALRIWSLGNQDNLKEAIEQVELPILWMAGERDQKYAEIARKMRLAHLESQILIVNESGHRIPWHQPEAFREKIEIFINTL